MSKYDEFIKLGQEVRPTTADVEGSQELKPCPFCGSEAVLSVGGDNDFSIHCSNLQSCPVCPEIQGEYDPDDDERESAVIRDWNTRPLDASKEYVRLEDVINTIGDFDNWEWCDCSECRADGNSHAIKTFPSLSRLMVEVRALISQHQETK